MDDFPMVRTASLRQLTSDVESTLTPDFRVFNILPIFPELGFVNFCFTFPPECPDSNYESSIPIMSHRAFFILFITTT